MPVLLRTSFLTLVLCTPILACGGAEIGESCDDVGSADECVDDAVCTNEEGDASRCRAICKDEEDCPTGHGCNGVSGTSTKSCQPD
jgi:hypothetical protein